MATSYYDAQGKFHGYQRSRRGRVTLIDVPGARDTIPIGVSETGVVAGEFIDASYNIHGFTWSKRHNFTLFDFPGAPSPFGAVIAVGDEGVIIGTYEKLYAPVQGFARYPKQTERDDTDD